jgi:hypothetical protein
VAAIATVALQSCLEPSILKMAAAMLRWVFEFLPVCNNVNHESIARVDGLKKNQRVYAKPVYKNGRYTAFLALHAVGFSYLFKVCLE